MTASNNYDTWLRSNPAPDLPGLVARCGGYQHIAPEEWVPFDRAMAYWRERWSRRLQGDPSEEIPHSDRSDPKALCICGLAGVYWRPRKGGGLAIWRCAEHRNRWPDYVDDVLPGRAFSSLKISTAEESL